MIPLTNNNASNVALVVFPESVQNVVENCNFKGIWTIFRQNHLWLVVLTILKNIMENKKMFETTNQI